jgi:hypothetical protein
MAPAPAGDGCPEESTDVGEAAPERLRIFRSHRRRRLVAPARG